MTFYSRKSPRMAGFDYSSVNYYFITICTYDKRCIFGTISKLNELGEIAKNDMLRMNSHYENIRLDNFIVMPNHIHAIVIIENKNDMESRIKLDDVIGLYKSGVSRKIRKIKPEIKVWQRSFHDHVIRNQQEYEKIWQYVQFNYQKWKDDCFYAETNEN